jgi:hypothetical protein
MEQITTIGLDIAKRPGLRLSPRETSNGVPPRLLSGKLEMATSPALSVKSDTY